MADDRDGFGEEGDVSSEVPAGFEADPPSYRSGRVRIIGAEPAGNAVHEVTGPVTSCTALPAGSAPIMRTRPER